MQKETTKEFIVSLTQEGFSMSVWLVTWRHTLLMACLSSMVLILLLPLLPNWPEKQVVFAGWWVEQQRQASLGWRVVRRSVPLPAWWWPLDTAWRWAQAGIWVGLTGGLLWLLVPNSGPAWQWLILVIASHKMVAAWRRAWQSWVQVTWQQVLLESAAFPAMTMPTHVGPEDETGLVAKALVTGGASQAACALSPAEQMITTLAQMVESLPIGTNLGLLHVLWALISGALLPSRGALFPALQAIGLPPKAVRRAWAAMWGGSWQIADLLARWEQYVEADQQWQQPQYDGYYPKAVDLTAFWRPALKGCLTKHYWAPAGKALQAIVLGLIARVGRVGDQRVALLTSLVRSDPADPSETALRARLLKQLVQTLADDEMPVLDAGFKIKELQAAGLSLYVLRLAKNFTARRNTPAPYKGKGRRPEYGVLVRPLARKYRDKTIPATPSNRVETWTKGELEFRVEMWDDLVLPYVKASPEAETFYVAAVHDPRFKGPWLLASPVKLTGPAWYGLYRARWPAEQPPLAAKQMLGAARQFVSAPESCRRLPELSLLAGNVLTYLAATLPAVPTGFWDRNPKPTPGRLRRVLAGVLFPQTYPLPARLRKKNSVVAHLPKGILGHRRRKQGASP